LIPKPFARFVAGAYASYDHAHKRHVVGIRLVVLLWTNGVICAPFGVVCWHHRQCILIYHTKNRLARLLVYWVVRHYIP
jgi:hypothetical protein